MSNRNNRRRIWAIAGVAAGFVASCNVVTAQIPCSYEVQIIASSNDCGGFGTVNTFGLGLNEHGDVVGYYKCPLWNHSEAFLWTAEEGFVTLDRPNGVTSAIAADINDNGVICGTVFVSGLDNRGFVYENGKWTILPPVVDVPGARSSANAINNANIVVGTRSLGEEYVPYSAYIWSADNDFTDLGDEYGLYSKAADVNEAGQAVIAIGPTLGDEAYVWDGQDLTPIGVIPGGFSSTPAAINTYAQVAAVGGVEDKESGQLLIRSFLWDAGESTLLGVLPGYAYTTAQDLNDFGIVVGRCRSGDNPNDWRAFIWQNRQIYDLNDYVTNNSDIFIIRGHSINSAGVIMARGYDSRGNNVAFLLTPIESPLGDLDSDCTVGVNDLLILLASWGRCTDCDDCDADFDNNCVVGASDLLILLANWG